MDKTQCPFCGMAIGAPEDHTPGCSAVGGGEDMTVAGDVLFMGGGGAAINIPSDYYRRDGTPYPPGEAGMLEWSKDFEKTDLRRVANTQLRNGLLVSTVWLGLDHGHNFDNNPNYKPLIFETMVFPWHRWSELDCERYSTEAEAKAGHEDMVKKWSGWKGFWQAIQVVATETTRWRLPWLMWLIKKRRRQAWRWIRWELAWGLLRLSTALARLGNRVKPPPGQWWENL